MVLGFHGNESGKKRDKEDAKGGIFFPPSFFRLVILLGTRRREQKGRAEQRTQGVKFSLRAIGKLSLLMQTC